MIRTFKNKISALLFVLLCALCVSAVKSEVLPPAVWFQPMASAPVWVGRGATLFIGYEAESGKTSMAAWRAGIARAGGKYVCQPSGDWAADNADGNLVAVLSPFYEIDNQVVSAQDANLDAAGKAKAIESLYVSVENFYRTSKAAAPAKPVALSIGLEQFRWHKADYARLAAACDWLIVDWYPIHRGYTPADLGSLLDSFKVVAGAKLKYVCVECSAQHLGVDAYPKQRCPTAAEMVAELNGDDARGLGSCLFPQQTAEDHATNPGAKFLYDLMPAAAPNDLVGAFRVWSQGRGVSQRPPDVPPAKGPLEGKTVTIDGFNYVLTGK